MLVLVRHGQTEHNAEGRLSGRGEVALTPLGRRQAEATAAAVRGLGPVSRIVSSPLGRALETAAAIGPDVAVDRRWVELDYGSYDGVPAAEVPASVWSAWRADPAFNPGQGETLVELGARVRSALADLAADGDGNVVVVSHVSPIKAAVAWALGVGDEIAWRLYLAPASITCIEIGPRLALHAYNGTAHLSGL